MTRPKLQFSPDVYDYPPTSGVGRIWHGVLPELRAVTDVKATSLDGVVGKFRRRIPSDRVWLHDGHRGPIWVRRAPVVTELHEAAWDHPETREHVEPGFADHVSHLSRVSVEEAHTVITLSASSKAQIVEAYGVEPARVFVGHLGVDHATFHPDAGPVDGVLAAAGADPQRPYVLFVSQLHPRKNLASLREAVARLAARGYPHQLVIVGGTPTDRRWDPDLFASMVGELPGIPGRITHLKNIEEHDLARLMGGAAAFCLPSFMEGFGLTALEAMACGAPVIVADRGSLPEVVGDAGVVVEPTTDAIEAALAEVLDDPSRAAVLGAAGAERAATFTWERTATAWLDAAEAAADLA